MPVFFCDLTQDFVMQYIHGNLIEGIVRVISILLRSFFM